MAQQDIAGLLTGIFAGDEAAQTQKLLGQKAVASNPNLLATTQTQIGRAPEQLSRMRQNVGGMFGQDLRSSGQKVQEQLAGLDVTTPAGQRQAVALISQIEPAKALALQTQFDVKNKEDQLAFEKAALDKKIKEVERARLFAGDKKAIREATAEARNNADRARQLIAVASDYERFEPTSGFLGQVGDKWAEFTGTQGGEQIARANFNALRSSVVADKLPPGAASDKDVALALEGYPTSRYSAEELSSFLRGQAKLAAVAAEREDARAEYMSKDGLDVGFSDKWAETLQQEGFDEKVAKKYGLTWTPVEVIDASGLKGLEGVSEETAARREETGNRIAAAMSRRGSRG
jgi:hypothetical protein